MICKSESDNRHQHFRWLSIGKNIIMIYQVDYILSVFIPAEAVKNDQEPSCSIVALCA